MNYPVKRIYSGKDFGVRDFLGIMDYTFSLTVFHLVLLFKSVWAMTNDNDQKNAARNLTLRCATGWDR
jgi:hypothetical protein